MGKEESPGSSSAFVPCGLLSPGFWSRTHKEHVPAPGSHALPSDCRNTQQSQWDCCENKEQRTKQNKKQNLKIRLSSCCSFPFPPQCKCFYPVRKEGCYCPRSFIAPEDCRCPDRRRKEGLPLLLYFTTKHSMSNKE